MSPGTRSSIRKLPPRILVAGNVVTVAIVHLPKLNSWVSVKEKSAESSGICQFRGSVFSNPDTMASATWQSYNSPQRRPSGGAAKRLIFIFLFYVLGRDLNDLGRIRR